MPFESKRLKVSSILLLIFNSIGAIALFVQLAQLNALSSVHNLGLSGLIAYLAIMGFIAVAFNYVVAGFGLKYWDVPEKAHICFRLGIALIILHIVNYVVGLIVLIHMLGSTGSLGFFNFTIGLILPIIYATGAEKIKTR